MNALAMNTSTGESTQYTNFNFTHIINISGKSYGVKSDGLYLLEGDTDDGVEITGSITTKDFDFGTNQLKRLVNIYLNADTATTVTPIVDGIAKPSHASSFGGRKTKMSRGNSGRFWMLKISGIIKLEGMEMVTESRQRRVK